MQVPVYAGQASSVQAAGQRRFSVVTWSLVLSVAVLAGLWGWYSFSLSKPRAVFSVQFDEPAETGSARFITDSDAIVLHNGRLMRYDLKGKKELWRSALLDKQEIAEQAAKLAAEEKAAYEELKKRAPDGDEEGGTQRWEPRSEQQIAASLEGSSAGSMRLFVNGKNIWVNAAGKFTRYDFDSGKAAQQVVMEGEPSRVDISGDSVLVFTSSEGTRRATRLDLISGHTEMRDIETSRVAAVTNRAGSKVAAKPVNTRSGTTVPNPVLDRFKGKRDPTLAENLAAPAIAASVVRNRQVEAAMGDETPAGRGIDDASGSQVFQAGGKLILFSTRLLEEKTLERQAMKAAPEKSALEGDVNASSTIAVANEIFNDFQRERTGGVEVEDVSRYEVSLKQLGAESPDWIGEVTGPPRFIPLNTIHLIAGGKSLSAFDQSNRKLWEARLNNEVPPVAGSWDDEFLGGGASAPAVERGRSVLLRDAGTLSCFDLATGNARWRLPSVGVSHLQFDDKGMLYAETTTASPDALKYSQQVDVSRRDRPMIIKIDPANGKLLWKSENNGSLAHVSGKFIYTLEWRGGIEQKEANPYGLPGAYTPPQVRIRRLSPKNGKVLWEHYQRRGPVDVKFRENQFEILFPKEFQVLRFWAL